MTPNVPMSESGTATLGMMGPNVPENAKTRKSEDDRDGHRDFDVMDGSANRGWWRQPRFQVQRRRNRSTKLWKNGIDAITAQSCWRGLAKDASSTAGFPLERPRLPVVSTESTTSAISRKRTGAPT